MQYIHKTDSSSFEPNNPKVVIVLPTYNEAQNLPELFSRLFKQDISRLSLIIVDDNSPDGTAKIARNLSDKYQQKVTVVQRSGKLGLGSAYVLGFSRALQEQPDYILQMDSDLSHPPEYIGALLNALKTSDVVVGSRYVTGGGSDSTWGPLRKMTSHLGNFGIRAITGLTVKDATSGFKAFTTKSLRSLPLDKFRCKGFGFQAEVAFACQINQLKVVEYPILFTDRTKGSSKMSLLIALEAIWRLSPLRLKKKL